MSKDPKGSRATASFEELAYSNMLVVEALVELLCEKGLLTEAELTDRVRRLKNETKVGVRRLQ